MAKPIQGDPNGKGQERRAQWAAQKRSNAYESSSFVKRELSADEKNACKLWAVDGNELWDLLDKAQESGYKFTFKFDSFSNSPACWMHPTSGDNPNEGWILTGRGSTPAKALKQALYKHYTMADENWATIHMGQDKWELDD